jgi:hypothetical protein
MILWEARKGAEYNIKNCVYSYFIFLLTYHYSGYSGIEIWWCSSSVTLVFGLGLRWNIRYQFYFHLETMLFSWNYEPKEGIIFLKIFSYLCIYFSFFLIIICAECKYIVAFTKVLTMNQIYHTLIHPLHCSFINPPCFLEQFQQVSFLHLHICIHIICTAFISFHHHLPLSPVPSPFLPWAEPVLLSYSLIL